MVLRSPRFRRRLAWTGGAAALAAGAGLAIALVPGSDGKPPAEHLRGAAMLPVQQVPLRVADRRKIDAALDRFVLDAVMKRNPERARGVLVPGIDPKGVYGYPARGTSFHDWTVNESTRGHVSLDLMLQPNARAAKTTGPIVFTIRLRESAGAWRVESLVPTAIFNTRTHKVTAAVDYGPGLGRDPPEQDPLTKTVLAKAWIAVPLGIAALVVAFPLVLLAAKWVRGRRAWRRYRRESAQAPLPWEWRDERAS